jgi:hypothetical protein
MRTEYKDTYYYIYVAGGGPIMGWIFFSFYLSYLCI